MLNFSEYLEEGKRGLWANIHAKRERIKNGSGERMRKPGEKGAPTAADFKAANEEVELDEVKVWSSSHQKMMHHDEFPHTHTATSDVHSSMSGNVIVKKGSKLSHLGNHNYLNISTGQHPIKLEPHSGSTHEALVKEELSAEEQFDLIEEMVMDLADEHNLDSEAIWETLESIEDNELLEYAIDKKGHKSSTGGLTQKGVDAYNRKTGGNLQTAVTTPPSKLDPDSKAAKRRKSFCARMGGVKGPMKDENGKPTRKALALRKWNC